jgi:hypothetical protein
VARTAVPATAGVALLAALGAAASRFVDAAVYEYGFGGDVCPCVGSVRVRRELGRAVRTVGPGCRAAAG